MKWVVIDTEGSGIFNYKLPAEHPDQPRLAALATICLDDDLSVTDVRELFVHPMGEWMMTPEATAVNGITDEILHERGVPVSFVLDYYTMLVKHEGRAVIAFNSQFDCKQMRGELRRAGMDDLFEITNNVCVMRKSKGVIPKVNGKNGWPSLKEACTFLNLDHEGAHGALKDAEDALAVFRYLHSRGVDLTPSVHYSKDHDAIVARSEA